MEPLCKTTCKLGNRKNSSVLVTIRRYYDGAALPEGKVVFPDPDPLGLMYCAKAKSNDFVLTSAVCADLQNGCKVLLGHVRDFLLCIVGLCECFSNERTENSEAAVCRLTCALQGFSVLGAQTNCQRNPGYRLEAL